MNTNRKKVIAVILSFLMFTTMFEPIMRTFAASGDSKNVTFIFTNKRSEEIPGIAVSLKDTDGNVIEASECNENKVIFSGTLENGTYNYTVDTGTTGYLAPESASIEITDEDMKVPIILYAPEPDCKIIETDSELTFGDKAVFEIWENEPVGMGHLSYEWYKDNELLENETLPTLEIDSVLISDAGVYSCKVTSDLAEEVVELTSTLSVSEATPQVNVRVDEKLQDTGGCVNLTAIVAHLYNENVSKPIGSVEFFIDGVSIGTAALADGKATLSDVTLNSDDKHSIYAKYAGTSDENYSEAVSSIITYGKITPQENRDYVFSEPNGDNGWYKKGGKFIITPMGEFDQIREGENGEWKTTLLRNEETLVDGTDVTFFLRNSATGEESNPQTVQYKMDNTAPINISVTSPEFSNYDDNSEQTYSVEFTAGDTLSGIAKIIWYDKSSNFHEVVPSLEDKFTAHLTAEQWKGITKIEAVDNAGNTSVNTAIENQSIEIVYSDAYQIVNANGEVVGSDAVDSESEYFYQEKPVTAELTVSSNNFSADDIDVTINEESASIDWNYNSEEKTYVGSITFLDEDEYVVSIIADGYTVFSNEYSGNTSRDAYTSNVHIIDTTPPEINVEYSPNALPTEMLAYKDTRIATVSVEEKNFHPGELQFASFSATDVQGNPLPNEDEVETAILNALRNAEWKVDGDIYTAEEGLRFSTDAKYSFKLTYTDWAGNKGEYEEAAPFVIDKSLPDNLKITYETNPFDILLEIITFGYYKPSVTVKLSADDAVSGIDYFNWNYFQEDGTSTSLNVREESGIIECSDKCFFYENNGKTAVATFTLTADEFKQYRGSISFSATDKAGNASNVHYGDGVAKDGNGNLYNTAPGHVVVLDTVAPTRMVTYPEPQQIRDKDTLAAYTGDKAERVNQENINSIIYYDNTYGDTIPITVAITEANFYAEDVKILVNNSEYTIEDWSNNGDEWTGKINLTEDGTYMITIIYMDRSGNEMTMYQSEKIMIDRGNPAIEKYEFEPADNNGIDETTEFIETLEYGYYFKTDFVLNIIASDSLSGVERITYRLVPYKDGTTLEEVTGTLSVTDDVAKLTIPARFKGQIFVESYDNAGNKSAQVSPQAFVIDASAPTVEVLNNDITTYKDAAGNQLYVADTSVTAMITDTVSGIKEITYAQNSEKVVFDRKIILDNEGYHVGDDLGDGWVVIATDANLVTKVAKTFWYSTDNNDIILNVAATDRSGNEVRGVTSHKFTVDKTAPVINIAFRADDDTDVYYDANRIADITVIERNFDASLVKSAIENKFGNVPEFTFTQVSNTEYTAEINFDEGDYTFEMSGTDMGNHDAIVNYSGGNEKLFYVDKTKPVVTSNFGEFSNNATENSFNEDKTVSISIAEHNFDSNLSGLRILRKDAGADHSMENLVDVTDEMIGSGQWNDEGDIHTITFTFSADAVYQMEMRPTDLAGNTDYQSTAVFEIDKTVPVVEKKNGYYVNCDDTQFLDIYTFDRKDEAAPTVDFSDLNINYIKYSLIVWKPDDSTAERCPVMKPVKVYVEEDTAKSGVISGEKFTLPEFNTDGVYALELTAVDIAGNESELNINTYARMVNQDVLAFIQDSNVERKTGVYSFQYENGTPISMRPDKFEDIEICVLAKKGTDADIVLRNPNAEEIYANTQETMDDSIYGCTIHNFTVKSDFFKDSFDDDTDMDLYLTVKNDGNRIDLGKMHIDNMAPECNLPKELRSWYWYVGEKSRTITITGISELLDEGTSEVYDNGEEIPFEYISENNTLTITLEKGWHSIGVILNDTAGNANNIQEKVNIHIGYFWLWIIIASSIVFVGMTIFITVIYKKRKRKSERE